MTGLASHAALAVLSGVDHLKRLSMGLMLDGYDELFTGRLREGVASPEEMALAADLLQKKEKQRRPKRPYWVINEAIVMAVLIRETNPQFVFKTVIPDVAKSFMVSERQVYNVLAERGLAKKEARRPLVQKNTRSSFTAFAEVSQRFAQPLAISCSSFRVNLSCDCGFHCRDAARTMEILRWKLNFCEKLKSRLGTA
jgi:hypothetical protein